ncbi:MAG: hypothetical protein AVDCRST_MAG35-709, partial [uncultured Quadrisphaera sp.]
GHPASAPAVDPVLAGRAGPSLLARRPADGDHRVEHLRQHRPRRRRARHRHPRGPLGRPAPRHQRPHRDRPRDGRRPRPHPPRGHPL